MLKVIINADDFGINKTVTTETIRLLKDEKISSATILANGDDLDEVRRVVKDYPNASFGIHLCLSEYGSLTKSSVLQKYGVIDGGGEFVKRAIFNVHSFTDELCDAIVAELSAQFEKLLSMDITLSHADSHHLIHTNIPQLYDCFNRVFEQYGIKKVRVGEELSVFTVLYHHLFKRSSQVFSGAENNMSQQLAENGGGERLGYISRLKRLVNTSRERHLTNKKYRKDYKTTDLYNSFNGFLYSDLKSLHIDSVELMCHPGHQNPEYISEIENIDSWRLNSLLNYQMISYNDL